ncbi:MAG TPA: TetR/AcrR family transcriptional regulator, partial [Gammaproteobacteria bacterium]|nr:TetR/AcrR family transcriptional regulator [Gammaproteobacteria bacterium]
AQDGDSGVRLEEALRGLELLLRGLKPNAVC